LKSARGGQFSVLRPLEGGLDVLKLHGSLDWRYSGPDGAPGDTIYVTNPGQDRNLRWDAQGLGFRNKDVEKLSLGLEPMIVPPAAVKSPYYNNRTLQAHWKRAAEELCKADELVIMGFSLPQTDLLVNSMLTTTLRERCKITPVNPDKTIVKRIRDAFQIRPRSRRVNRSFVGVNDAIPGWVEENVED
jgi:hypothetical protein